MDQVYSYRLSKLTDDLDAEIIFKSTDFDDVLIYTGDVHRPGLQLADFYEHFEPTRIQLIGHMEAAYMDGLPRPERLRKWETLLSYKVPAIIICHAVPITGALQEAAEKCNVTILRAHTHTTETMSKIIRLIKREIAPRLTRSGVLVDVYGVGLLLVGESGVGKSETAIELLKRGHRLIADDAVEIKNIDVNVIQGTAPDLIRHYVELRGLGVIDVRQIFGSGAIKDYQNIHLVCNIEIWKEHAHYDRLGITEDSMDILGVRVPMVTIPIKPGRNLAVILEVAAMNQRQKFMGHNAAVEFSKQIDRHMDEKLMENIALGQDRES